jgi:hypothetical protein
MQVPARYDGHADWYDSWAQSAGAGVMAVARSALAELLPSETRLDRLIERGGSAVPEVIGVRVSRRP